jgi:hypothetical protein
LTPRKSDKSLAKFAFWDSSLVHDACWVFACFTLRMALTGCGGLRRASSLDQDRIGLEYHKPQVIPRRLGEAKQLAFVGFYEKLLNGLGPDEAVLFAEAVHPIHATRSMPHGPPAAGHQLAIEQISGRQRINIHGAVNLETGQTRMIEALTIDAASTIASSTIASCNPSRHSTRPWRASMCSSTMPAMITQRLCANGLSAQIAGSSCISSRPMPSSQSD